MSRLLSAAAATSVLVSLWFIEPVTASADALCPAPGVTVTVDAATMQTPGALQGLVDACPGGTSFSLPAGTFYGFRTIYPKSGDSFRGQGPAATVLLGSTPIAASNFTPVSPSLWADSVDVRFDTRGIAQADDPFRHNCAYGYYPQPAPNPGICSYPDLLFMDGRWLTRVLGPDPASPCPSVKPGQYCIDYGVKRIFLGSDPTGHTFTYAAADDGTGHLLQNAIQNVDRYGHAVTDVMISDLTASQYANTDGAGGVIQTGNGWTVQNVVSSYNHGCGLTIAGKDPTQPKLVQNSTLTANGKAGFCGVNAGTTFDHNMVTYNNQDFWNPPHGAGGGKSSGGGPLTITNSIFSYNRGNGFSTDVGEQNVTLTGNTFSYNTTFGGGGDGLHLEVSCYITVGSNSSYGNSRVGILVLNSHDITVGGAGVGNTVGGNGVGEVKIVSTGRTSWSDCGSATASQNNLVLGNSITLTKRDQVGIANQSRCASCLTGSLFDGNSYETGGYCTAKKWVWSSRGWVPKPVDFTTWQTTAVQDTSGSCS